METIIVYWGLYRDNGTENGNYYSILGLYEPWSKLLVSPLISPIVVPCIAPYITPIRSLDYGSYRDN